MDITVRRAESGDFEAVWRIYTDESAYSGTLQLPMPSRELWRRRLAEPAEGHDFALRDGRYGDVLAMARLKPKAGSR